MSHQLNSQQNTQTLYQDQVEGKSALDTILHNSRLDRDEGQENRARASIQEFAKSIIDKRIVVTNDLEASLNARIAEIDRLLTLQVNEIIHDPKFQSLEASWRGLRYFVFETETSTNLKLKVLNATKAEIFKDLSTAIDFDQSQMFKKFYEEQYGTFGGEPFSFIVGDFEFTNHPQDMALLSKISKVAAAAHAPFISASSPEFFGWEKFETLIDVQRDMAKIPDQEQYAKWKAFRDSEESRYVALTLPHILLREPYGEATHPTETFNFEEDVDGTDSRKYCWGNAAYALATRITESIAIYNWPVAIRGVENGGLIQNLPIHTFKTDEGDVAIKCPTEIAITDRREKEFSDLGFIPIVYCLHTDKAAFFGAQTANKPKKYNNEDANANARLATELPYILAVSRFAHYLKVKMREKIGSFTTQNELEKFLNDWVSCYVLDDDSASQEAKARFPLRAAKIHVVEVKGKPGYFTSIAHFQPHCMLNGLTMSIRLVAAVPGSQNS